MKIFSLMNKAFPLLVAAIIGFHSIANTQEAREENKDDKVTEIQNLVQSKRFVFVAQNAAPTGGRTINLTSIYDIRLSNDTLISQLPYFGRAYVAPINPSEGGINFTSTNFSYAVNPRKKGGWDITLMPKDTKDVRQMFLSVSEKGYASLQVTSNNRQPISFTGYITSKEKFR